MKWFIDKLQLIAQKLQNIGGPTNRFFQEVTWVFMLVADVAQDIFESETSPRRGWQKQGKEK